MSAVVDSSCRWLIRHTNLFVAWLFNVVYSLALVFISTWSVVTIAPQAGGAGVAEVMAYLNGCQLPKVRLTSIWLRAYQLENWQILGSHALGSCILICCRISSKQTAGCQATLDRPRWLF